MEVTPTALEDAGRAMARVAGALHDVRATLAANGRAYTGAFDKAARAEAEAAVDAWAAALARLAGGYGNLGAGLADVATYYVTADERAVPR